MKYENEYAEVEGFSVEVDGEHLIVSSDNGDTHEVGPAEDSDEATEMIADAINGWAYSIAQQLVKQLNPTA